MANNTDQPHNNHNRCPVTDLPFTEIAGRRVLFLMAAEPEYGPRLRALFRPVITGVGPVEGGVVAAATLAQARAAGQGPDLVVSLGSPQARPGWTIALSIRRRAWRIGTWMQRRLVLPQG